MKYIAVLLTVFNRKENTLKCLERVFCQKLLDEYQIDIWMTDDGCTDGTSDSVRSIFPSVNIVKGDGTLFWNRGMHAAWAAARKFKDYDYYLWLNDDTYIYDNCIMRLIEACTLAKEKAIIVGATSSVGDSTKITYGAKTRKGNLIVPNGKLQECSNAINGNIILIPLKVFSVVGMNDPTYHHMYGDHDYALRAIKAGFKCYIAPQICGECNRHENIATWCDATQPMSKRWKDFHKNTGVRPDDLFIFNKTHYGLIKACFVYITSHIHCLFPILWNNK